MNNVNMDALRLIVQGVVAVGVLTAASFLTISGHLTSDAVVALYGAAIGAVAGGAVGGSRVSVPPHSHTNGEVTSIHGAA